MSALSPIMKPVIRLLIAGLALPLVTASLQAQDQPGSQNPNRAAADAPPDRPPGPGPDGPPPFGPGGGRGPGGPQEIKIVEKFDKNGDKRLDAEERKPAREFLAKERAEGRLGRGPGGPGGRGRGPGQGPAGNEANRPPGDAPPPRGPEGRPGGPEGFGRRENQPPPQPGPKLTPAEVKNHPEAPLYDTGVLQTLFLEFDNAEWEKEMVDFKGTDVEVPAKLTVDGKVYNDVGVHFRGASSFGVGEGRKRSLNLSLDFIHKKQDLKGYRTLNLLNSNGDPTFLRAALYHRIAREYLPSPQANWVRVVINGESWGVYVNVQQFNKDFIEEWFGTAKGARWKAPGRPNGNSGLEYLGEEVAEYKKRFEIKSKDEEPSWKALIELCRVLNQTPPAELHQHRWLLDTGKRLLALPGHRRPLSHRPSRRERNLPPARRPGNARRRRR